MTASTLHVAHGGVPAGKEETDHRIVVGVGWTFGS